MSKAPAQVSSVIRLDDGDENNNNKDDWMSKADDLVRDNLRIVRLAAVWGPIVGVAVALSRSRYYRQVRASRNVRQRSVATNRIFRGRVVQVINPRQDMQPYMFHFYHVPLARRMFWVNHDVNAEDAMLCRLAGVRVHHTPEATNAFKQEMGLDSGASEKFGKWITVQVIARDSHSSKTSSKREVDTNDNDSKEKVEDEEEDDDDVLAVIARHDSPNIFWLRWFNRHRDIALAMLRNGHAECRKHSALSGLSSERTVLTRRFPKIVAAYDKAERRARRSTQSLSEVTLDVAYTGTRRFFLWIWSLIRRNE